MVFHVSTILIMHYPQFPAFFLLSEFTEQNIGDSRGEMMVAWTRVIEEEVIRRDLIHDAFQS